MAIQLIWIDRQIEARIVGVPVDLFAGAYRAVPFLCSVEALFVIGAAKTIGKVFFAGQVSAPRGFTVGAVLEGSQHTGACVVGWRAQQGVACSRAAEADRRIAVYAAVEGRVLHKLPP